MRDVAQCVDDQIVQAFEERGRRVRQGTEIGEIGGAAKAKAEHFEVAVQQGDGNNLRAHQLKWAIDDVEVHARDGALRGSVIEDVREGAAKHAKRFFRAVHGQGGFLADVEGANVVEAEDVFGVGVGEQNGVEAIEANTQCLLAKGGRGGDDRVFSAEGQQQRRTHAIF